MLGQRGRLSGVTAITGRMVLTDISRTGVPPCHWITVRSTAPLLRISPGHARGLEIAPGCSRQTRSYRLAKS